MRHNRNQVLVTTRGGCADIHDITDAEYTETGDLQIHDSAPATCQFFEVRDLVLARAFGNCDREWDSIPF